MKDWYVYIALCADGTYYTGMTDNIEQRIETHNSGKGSKYTRGRLPVKLVYSETLETRGAALSREAEIKNMTREEKETLVKK